MPQQFKNHQSTGDLTGNEIASPQKNSETNEEEILRERYIPPELRHKIILRVKIENY